MNIIRKELISTCDDAMFMSGEIILNLDTSDGLNGVKIELDLQSHPPIYLRKEEIKELINNLQEVYNLL